MSIPCTKCGGVMHVCSSKRRLSGITRRYICRGCNHRLTLRNDSDEHLSRQRREQVLLVSCHHCIHWTDGGCSLAFPEPLQIGPQFARQCAAHAEARR